MFMDFISQDLCHMKSGLSGLCFKPEGFWASKGLFAKPFEGHNVTISVLSYIVIPPETSCSHLWESLLSSQETD